MVAVEAVVEEPPISSTVWAKSATFGRKAPQPLNVAEHTKGGKGVEKLDCFSKQP